MFKFLLFWLCTAFIINICIRYIFKITPRQIIYNSITGTNSSDYLSGYLAGITNVKMYYYIVGDMPPSNWLDANKFHILNDRPKLVKTLSEETKRGAGIIDNEHEV